jgi:thiol-disulfide isomerase/thioredoxin
MPVLKCSDEELSNFVFNKPLLIVKFHTAEECPTCDKMLIVFERLSNYYKNFTFILMNADDNPTAKDLIDNNKKPFFGIYNRGLLIESALMESEEELTTMLERAPNILIT